MQQDRQIPYYFRVTDADKIDRLSEVSADLHLLWTAPEILRLAPADRSIFGDLFILIFK